jgi:hypothetical protein
MLIVMSQLNATAHALHFVHISLTVNTHYAEPLTTTPGIPNSASLVILEIHEQVSNFRPCVLGPVQEEVRYRPCTCSTRSQRRNSVLV